MGGVRDASDDTTANEALPTGGIRSGKLAGKSLPFAIWILAWPVLLQQMMQACVGLADKYFAGNLPEAMRVAALDAVGIGSYVGWFIVIAMAGLGIGGQAVIARAIGAGRLAEADHALGQAMTLALIWGAIVGVALWWLVLPLVEIAGLKDEAANLCIGYVRVLAAAMPLTAVMLAGGMCLHGAGETTKPSLIAVSVNVANVVVSWILSGADLRFGETIITNPFPFDLHVYGIAAGTAVAYGLGAVITMFVMIRGVKDLRLHAKQMPPKRVMSRRIIRVGVPNFFEGISMWAVNLFVLMFIGIIAEMEGGIAGLQGAHVIAVQWEAFSFLPGFAIGTAAGALAGQFIGAGNAYMAKKAVVVCTAIGAVVMGMFGVILIVFAEPLTAFISAEPIHLEQTPPLLRICGSIQVFFALTMVVRQGLRGVGDTKWTFIITTVSSYGVRLPMCWLLGVYFELGLTGIWIGLCGELVVRSMLFVGRFIHGGWQRLEI